MQVLAYITKIHYQILMHKYIFSQQFYNFSMLIISLLLEINIQHNALINTFRSNLLNYIAGGG
jgi:hypothetical protein